jgi:protease I
LPAPTPGTEVTDGKRPTRAPQSVDGRTLTSWPSLRTDLTNAGATWVDEQVHVDGKLVTSRKPDDLPAFCDKLIEQIA